MSDIFLSVIIPAYNEAERLPSTLIDMDKFLEHADFSYEILVVNDGSSDNTAEIVKKMSSAIKNLKLIDDKQNKGKGGAVKQGMLLAKGKYRLFSDADNATSLDQFEKMRPFFNEGFDIVIGDRAIKGSKLEPPETLLRRIAGKLGNLWIQALLLPGIWDTQCGFKAFTAEAAEKIFSLSRATGWAFDVEILSLAKKLGYKIKAIPVHWVDKSGSKIRPSSYLNFLAETIKIRWWLWTGKYNISANQPEDKEQSKSC